MLKDEDPRGSLEELTALKVNLVKFGSCARKQRDEDGQVVVRGCSVRKWCELAEKEGKGPATSGHNGRGPCHKGIEAIKVMPNGDRVVTNTVMTCFHLPGFKQRIERRGATVNGVEYRGIVRVIASEGETIRSKGSKQIAAPGTATGFEVKDEIRDEVVTHFPRPGTAGNLPEQKLIAEVTQRVADERRAAAPARLLGIEDEEAREAH